MLQPSNRLTLIDAMRPPAGFGLESAMGVTFTLDLRALLAAPAAFALSGAGGIAAADGSQQEPIELLHAVRAHARRLTLFSQVGEIALPPARRVFAFLERSVIPVRAPRGGVVHPKVWVLRYGRREDDSEQRLRVLIASRNLTFDASWDTVVRLDESDDGRGVALTSLGDLFEGLLTQASPLVASPEHAERVASLSEALRVSTFALPPGVDDLTVDVFGFTAASSPLPRTAHRSLILSPFVSDDFFADVHPVSVDELVSRPESLDQLSAASLAHVRSAYAFDDGSSVELGGGEEQLSPRDPGRPLVGLHAKVFAFEEGQTARLFLGSANATAAAFRRNVEVLVELRGPVETLGIDRLCDGTGDELGLRDLFAPFAAGDDGPDATELRAIDRARRSIALLSIEGVVEETDAGWAVAYRSREPVPAADGAAIHCWPLASPGNRRRVPQGQPLDARFETTLEAISGFLAFEIVDDEETRTEFVVPVPLAGVPAHRERALLRALIGRPERFLRYLLALLADDTSEPDLVEMLGSDAEPDGDDRAGPGLPVLEKLLRTMRRDPAKLAALDPLVGDLAGDDALPVGFAGLWGAIAEVAGIEDDA